MNGLKLKDLDKKQSLNKKAPAFPKNVPLTFDVKLVKAGEKTPYYSRSWRVANAYGDLDVERLMLRTKEANELKASSTGFNLVEWKAVTGSLRVRLPTSVPLVVCYPVFEPTSNEFGEVAP